jgi:hypothetical protein
MSNLSKDDKVQLSRIFESVQGRIDEKLLKLIMDFIFGTKVKTRKDDFRLFSSNLNKIPDKSIESFSLGDFFGQAYQISLNFATKMNLKLNVEQKRLLREYVFFLVLFKFEKESNKK